MKIVAIYTKQYCLRSLFLIFFICLTACAFPTPPARPLVYDFGPGTLVEAQASPVPTASHAVLMLIDINTSLALDSSAMLYRLAYSNPQQILPYTLARWSMPPAQLLRQRLRERLGERHLLLHAGDRRLTVGASPVPSAPLVLQLELEEFSQWFEAPDKSAGLLRLRATLTQASTNGVNIRAQRSFTQQRPAPSPDAQGGVRALTEASEAVALALEAWVLEMGR